MRQLLPLYTLIVFLTCFASRLWSQQPYALQYHASQGWPSNVVYDIYQDSKGFIWTATNEGLSRYDGQEHVFYRNSKQSSFPGSCIKEDRFGRIWYENFDGFVFYTQNDSLGLLSQNSPIDFLHYGITDEFIFVVQKKGIDVFDLETTHFIKTISVDNMDLEYAESVGNHYYFIRRNVVYQITPALQLKQIDFFKSRSISNKAIYPTNDGLLVISKSEYVDSVYFFSKDFQEKLILPIDCDQAILDLTVLDNKIWIHTAKGSMEYTSSLDKRLLPLSSNIYFNDHAVSGMIRDRQDNYWFTTLNAGVFLVPELTSKKRISNEEPFALIEPFKKGFIAAGKKNEFVFYDQSLNKEKVIATSRLPYYMFVDTTNNNVFYSTNGFSMVVNEDFEHPTDFQFALKAMVKLDEKYYAFAASRYSGLLRNPLCDNGFKSKWDDYFEAHRHERVNVAALKVNARGKSIAYQESSGNVMLATNLGLFEIGVNGEREITNKGESVFAKSIVNFKDELFILDSRGTVFTYKNGVFTNCNEQWGIAPFEITSIKRIDHRLVIITKLKILIFDLASRSTSDVSLILFKNKIHDVFIKDHVMFLATDQGLISSNLDVAKKKDSNAIFRINKVLVNGEAISDQNLLDLKMDQNRLSIQFSILDFGMSRENVLSFRVNNSEWNPLSEGQRRINLTSLSPGHYLVEFQVNGNVVGEHLAFEIKAPFWRKAWFYFLIGFIILLSLIFYSRWQINLMRNQVRLLNEKVKLEKSLSRSVLTAVKSQMNPHFFYNALNTIQAYIFTNDKQNATNYLSKFSKLTRMILEMSERENIRLSEEVQALTLYLELEGMRFQEDFKYSFRIDESIDTSLVHIPSMLIQPYVENAIKHGLLHKQGEKRVEIVLTKRGELLCVSIDDNGIGRKKADELNHARNERHESFASSANEKRLDILNRHLANRVSVEYTDKLDSYNNAIGTMVVLLIPMN